MAGKPFKVGRFAHTLRVRLMREHLGVDVDALYEEDFQPQDRGDSTEQNAEPWDPDKEQDKISPAEPKLEEDSVVRIPGESSAIARMAETAMQGISQCG